MINEEFGVEKSEIFSEFGIEPIGAASLAEVYEARLKSTGERVAVKVQYIDLKDRFSGDMLTIRLILYALAKLFPKFDFSWILDSATKNLERELNFRIEAENAERCSSELSSRFDFIYVPKIFWDFTTERILVMEFIDGFKVSDVEQIRKSNLSLKQIDAQIVEAMAFQIFHSGFVHADPHVRFCFFDFRIEQNSFFFQPGNIYVRQNPKTPGKPNAQIVLLDHGLYETIEPDHRESLCQLWKSILVKDEEKMKFFSKQLGVQGEFFDSTEMRSL